MVNTLMQLFVKYVSMEDAQLRIHVCVMLDGLGLLVIYVSQQYRQTGRMIMLLVEISSCVQPRMCKWDMYWTSPVLMHHRMDRSYM